MAKLFFVFALFISFGAALNGCGEEQPPKQNAERRSGLKPVGETSWLTTRDDVRPEVWLIEHETRHGAKSSVAGVGQVRRSLVEASNKFNDTPRMIANRAVQLEQMLKEEGGNETAIVLIDSLSGVIAPGHMESFGAAGQQYYNLRKAGFTGEQALDALSKRYGSRS